MTPPLLLPAATASGVIESAVARSTAVASTAIGSIAVASVALGLTVVAPSAIAAAAPTAILAGDTPTSALSSDTKLKLRIPAGDAHTQLNEFMTQTGCTVAHNVDELVGVRTRGLRGKVSPTQALARMFRHKGFTAELLLPPCNYVLVRTPRLSPEKRGNNAINDLARDAPEEIIVTGSYLPSKPISTPDLLVITRTDLASSSYATLHDALRPLPQVHGGGASQDTQLGVEAQSNFTFGTGINLRGLNAGATLLLVNGGRVPASGSEGAFSDASGIPLNAIERIEILPNGTSAIYGADAVGGVVNVIMRKHFAGQEAAITWGSVTEGSMHEFSLSNLMGTEWRRGGGYLALEYQERGALPAGARDQWTSDLTAFGGSDFDSLASNPGTLIIGGRTWAIPRGQDGTQLDASQFVPSTANKRDVRAEMDALPSDQILKTYMSGHYGLLERLELETTASFSDRRTRHSGDGAAGSLPVPVSNPFYATPLGDTFPSLPVTVAYNFFHDLGPLRREISVRSKAIEIGLVASLGETWTLEERGRYAEERGRSLTDNLPGSAELIAALADSNPATALNVFGDGSHTNPATLEAVRTSELFSYQSIVAEMNFALRGALGHMTAGPIRLALGANRRIDSFSTNRVSEERTLDMWDRYTARTVTAAYGEASIPFVGDANRRPWLEQLELSAAIRVERYSDVGRASTPRLRLLMSPFRSLQLRANWALASLAPHLGMVGSDSWSTVVSALDPQSVFGSSLVLVRFGDNPDLRAEDASSFTLSASYTPPSLSGLQLAASYFALSASGRPAAVPYTYNLLNDPAYASVITRNPSAQLLEDVCDADDISDASLLACRDVDAPIAAIADLRTQNTVGQKTRGVDFTGRYSFNTVRGAPTIGLMGTYVFDYLVSAHVGEPYVERVNMQHNPLVLRFRASLHWKPSSFGGGAYLNFASAYRDDASLPERPVSQWTTMDLQVFYESDPWGADAFSLRVALDVLNAFNEPPPFLNNPVGVGYDQENGDLRGRMALLTVRARF